MKIKFRLALILAGFIASTGITWQLVMPSQQAYCDTCSTPPVQTDANSHPLAWSAATVTVYAASTFSAQEYADIQNAINEWNAQGKTKFQLASQDVSPPAINTPGTIQILDTPPSVNNIAQTVPFGSGTTITSATIRFDRNFQITDPNQSAATGTTVKVKAYDTSQGNADNFFTILMAHEFGHALGLNDFTDSNNTVIDSPSPSVMGIYSGTNNNGFPAYGDNLALPPGNLSAVTSCDQARVIASETANKINNNPAGGNGGTGSRSGGGGTGAGGSGSGGNGPRFCYEDEYWDDATNTLTEYTTCQ